MAQQMFQQLEDEKESEEDEEDPFVRPRGLVSPFSIFCFPINCFKVFLCLASF